MKNRIKNHPYVSLLTLVVCGTMALSGCGNQYSTGSSSDSSSSAASSSEETSNSSEDTSSTSVDTTPKVTVADNLEVTWGEEVDPTSFFTITVGNAVYKVTADMVTGTVNSDVEGTYPLTLSTTVNDVALTAHANVVVISKDEISLPYGKNPSLTSISNNLSNSEVTLENIVNCFAVKIDNQDVDVQPSWLVGNISNDYGSYPITLNVPVTGKTFSSSITVNVVDHAEILASSYTEDDPYILEQDTMVGSAFYFTLLYNIAVSNSVYTLLKDSSKNAFDSKGNVVYATFDYSAVKFDTSGIYEVKATATTNTGEVTVSSYIKIISNVHVEAASTTDNWFLKDGDYDLAALFKVTEGEKEVAGSEIVVDQGDFDITKPGAYNVKGSYKDVEKTIVVTVFDSSFFGNYTYQSLTSGTYSCSFGISGDGSVEMTWKTSDTAISVKPTGYMGFDSDGKCTIETENEVYTSEIHPDVYDGCLVYVYDYVKTTKVAADVYYNNVYIYVKDSDYTIDNIYLDAKYAGNISADIIQVSKGGTTSYWVLCNSNSYTYHSYYGFYQGTDIGIDLNTTTKTGSLVIKGLGTFTLSLTVVNNAITAVSHSAFLSETAQAATDKAKIADFGSRTGVTYTDSTDSTKSVKVTCASLNYDRYTVTAKVTGILDMGTSAASNSFIISYDDNQAVLIVCDTVVNSDKLYAVALKKLTLNIAKKTYTIESMDDTTGINGDYLSTYAQMTGGTGYQISVGWGYVFVKKFNTSLFSLGQFGKITENTDGTYTVNFTESTSAAEDYHITVKSTNNGNNLAIVDSNYLSYSSGYEAYYVGLKGDCSVKGSTVTLSTSQVASTETSPITDDYLKSLFSGKVKDDDGNVVDLDVSKLLITGGDNINSVGVYPINASYTVGTSTYYFRSFINVIASPYVNNEIVGTYYGFLSNSNGSKYRIVIAETGVVTVYLNTNTAVYNASYLVSQDGNYFLSWKAGVMLYNLTLTYKDGAIFGVMQFTSDSDYYLVACKIADPNSQAIGTVTAMVSYISTYSNQAILLTDTNGSTVTQYYMGLSYYGKVTATQAADASSLPDIVTDNTKSLYTIADTEGNQVATFRFYSYLYGSKKIALGSDSLLGSYTTDDGINIVIDGFGSITVDGKNYNYVIGNDDRILVYDANDNYAQKYIFDINVSSKTAVEILEEDKKTVVTNTTGSSSFFFYNDKQYTCYAVNYTFDGYGFVTVKNGQGTIQSFFSYTYSKESESIEISSSFYQHSVTFSKTDALTYVNNDNNMNFLSSSYAVFNGTAITFAEAE